MSSILSTELAGHSFDDRWLFRNLTIGLQRGQKVAMVGANGAGKSTFLKILGGIIQPAEGKVVRERGLKIGYLDQDPDFSSLETVADYVYSNADPRRSLLRKYSELIESENINQQELDETIAAISQEGAWEYEHLVKSILARLSITNLDQTIATLSGGQRKRLALAGLLIDEPDLYILDEPTNHLDIGMIEWLEKYLTTGSKTVIMVTHDRYFLDQVCNRIIEIAADGVFNHNGKYATFLEKKATRMEEQASTQQKNKQLLKKELEWMRRQPQARGTKSKSRIHAFYELEEQVKATKNSQSLNLDIRIARQGKNILELRTVSKSFVKPILEQFSYVFKQGDRIGIAGSNGSGKSTLLNLIAGVTLPDSGQVIKGETTAIGYYKQTPDTFERQMRVIDVIKNKAEYIALADGSTITASQLLTQFLFPPARQHVPVALLSGGERKRLQLMNVLIRNPNFLILDEPTNDLDIDTLNVLEDFLERYKGVLLLVSHDRYLMDRLCDQLFIMDQGVTTIFNGNYSDYRTKEQEDPKPSSPNIPAEKTTKSKKSLSFKEQKELETLEAEISNDEQQLLELAKALGNTTDFSRLTTLSEEIQLIRNGIDKKSERWMELIELSE